MPTFIQCLSNMGIQFNFQVLFKTLVAVGVRGLVNPEPHKVFLFTLVERFYEY